MNARQRRELRAWARAVGCLLLIVASLALCVLAGIASI